MTSSDSITSGIVEGFESVSIAVGLRCPSCRGRSLIPHDVSLDDNTIRLQCPTCSSVVFEAELVVEDADGEEGEE